MADACYTARATTKQQVLDGIEKLTLLKNENGQYTHDAILLLQKGIIRVRGERGTEIFLLSRQNEVGTLRERIHRLPVSMYCPKTEFNPRNFWYDSAFFLNMIRSSLDNRTCFRVPTHFYFSFNECLSSA